MVGARSRNTEMGTTINLWADRSSSLHLSPTTMRAPHSSAILLFFLSLSTRTAAQPVLASADIGYHVGDAYAFLAWGPQSFPLTGAGLTWYYTNLSGWQSGTTTIVDASTTEGASYFPSSTVADQYPGYPDAQYYTTTDTDQVWLGYYQGANIASICSDPRTDLIWPFTYGSTFTDSLICDEPGVYHRTRSGEQTVSGEGYGTLVLPFGSFADCLLIHRHWNYFDDYDELVPGHVQGDTYSFYKAGIHAPLLSIGYSTYTQADSTIVNQGTSMISELSTGLARKSAAPSSRARSLVSGSVALNWSRRCSARPYSAASGAA